MESPQTDSSPAAAPYISGKLKKPLFYLLIYTSACFAFLAPLLASASIFSFGGLISALTPSASAGAPSLNSQTLPLLSPATNIDPKPSVGGGDIALVAGSALLPQDGPSGTVADIESSAPSSSSISVYTVHRGDTLAGIAKMFGVSVNTIVWANNLQGGAIHEGDTLIILPITGVRYTIKKGDTLASVAKVHGADAAEVASYNDLTQGDALAVGQVIIIPDGEIAAPKPAATARSSSSLLGVSNKNVSGYFGWPVAAGVITQGLHGYNGVDIGAPMGTGVLASAAGTVIIARSGGYNGGYGSYVVLQHNNGTQTLYAHLSKVYVSVGDSVGKGALIGAMGSTGKSTGSHLHFEVRNAVNPFGR